MNGRWWPILTRWLRGAFDYELEAGADGVVEALIGPAGGDFRSAGSGAYYRDGLRT
jgi:hypothetical protein